jgi:mRNA interferase MazF
LVVISASGDYGKPRPGVVVQSDSIATDSVLVAQITSEIVDAPLYRLTVEPTEANGLVKPSQVMVDKIVTMRRSKCGPVRGRLDDAALLALGQMLAVVLGLAG